VCALSETNPPRIPFYDAGYGISPISFSDTYLARHHLIREIPIMAALWSNKEAKPIRVNSSITTPFTLRLFIIAHHQNALSCEDSKCTTCDHGVQKSFRGSSQKSGESSSTHNASPTFTRCSLGIVYSYHFTFHCKSQRHDINHLHSILCVSMHVLI